MAKFIPDSSQFNHKKSPVIIYRMYGQFYMRSRSSLDGKRVKTDPAFRSTMDYARLFGKASAIAAAVYRAIQLPKKNRRLYNLITGHAMRMLRCSGRPANEIASFLFNEYKIQSGKGKGIMASAQWTDVTRLTYAATETITSLGVLTSQPFVSGRYSFPQRTRLNDYGGQGSGVADVDT